MAEDALKKKLKHLPASPGVYLFKDARGEILYIGKSRSLRSRVRSHFAQDPLSSPKSRELIRRTADVDTIVVGSDAEALLLEANLIKSHHPRFNIQLRDDKRYPYLKVTLQERFPRVLVTRLVENDGARYFGPYTEVGAMRHSLELIRRIYPVRSCHYNLPDEAPARPCLDYHIGRCEAPCVGLQSEPAYRAMIGEVIDVLSGRTEAMTARVTAELEKAVGQLEFERAAKLRDVLAGLRALEGRQRALDIRGGDQDVVGVARDGDSACAVLLRVRGGKLLGREVDFFENLDEETDAALHSAAASRFYLGRGDHGMADLPREVLLPGDFEDRAAIEAVLTEAAGRRVRTHAPQRGDKRRLVELASQNARHLLEERYVLAANVPVRADDLLYELQEALELKVVPRLVVCFDISHTQGTEVAGSAVTFRNGEPDKSGYRRFRVRGDGWNGGRRGGDQLAAGPGGSRAGLGRGLPLEAGNDDYRAMSEVVGRYFRRRIEEGEAVPELAVIDGGKGQLNVALSAIREAGVSDVEVCSLAKAEELVYLPNRSTPVRLPRTSNALRLLQRIRNEAHRFAHDYNRRLRRRRTLASELSEVPGIGPARQRFLLERFGSVRALREARREDIAALPGFSEGLAGRVLSHLGKEG